MNVAFSPPSLMQPDIGGPYPGLRPFQESEAAYFYGREAQVKEIIARLRQTQFVAVLGGSGSGKSSLVLAGAIPELRSYALAPAGDFWIPVFSTPGTNHVAESTPLARVASRFCGVLNELSEPQSSRRREECVKLLRNPDGFAEIVDKFGTELADTAGVDPRRANFLLLIDQFEEVFHPSNRDTPDRDALVERVLDNFRHPHPRVFLIITMRTEHLSECAKYLELPDAINKASYLVRRLDVKQLREAIEKPAQRYLQIRMRREQQERRRGTSPSALLPESSRIDADVLERLLRDSGTLSGNPDHLPLLQHLLFRIWEAASARVLKTGLALPDRIVAADLSGAVQAAPAEAALRSLPSGTNCLEECLENWARRLYRECPNKMPIARVFKALAFKEPNTGTYTQQRAAFNELVTMTGLSDEQDLRRLLEPWLTPHGYLFWDADNCAVKVAHESFIRGWSEFRLWIDEEDEVFEEYVRLLEECRHWSGHGGPLDASRLRRLKEVGLKAALDDPRATERLDRLLALHRDGHRLRRQIPRVPEFLAFSRKAVNRSRRSKQLGIVLGVGFLVVGVLLGVEIQLARKERAWRDAYGHATETLFASDYQFGTVDDAQLPLRNLLTSSWERATADGIFFPGFMRFLARVTWRGERVDSLERTRILAETRGGQALRSMLGWLIWPVSDERVGLPSTAPERHLCAKPWRSVPDAGPSQERLPDGPVWFYGRTGAEKVGLAITEPNDNAPLQIFPARLGENDACELGNFILALPPGSTTRVAMDADLWYLLVATSRGDPKALTQQDTVQLSEIVWPLGDQADAQAQVRGSINSADLAKRIWNEQSRVVRLPSVRRQQANATDLYIADGTVRLFSLAPRPLAEGVSGPSWRRVKKLKRDSGCADLWKKLKRDALKRKRTARAADQPGRDEDTKSRMLEEPAESICVLLTMTSEPRRRSLLSVYRVIPGMPVENKRMPVLPPTDFGDGEFGEVLVGTNESDGWIAARIKGHADQWVTTPWKVDTWKTMACGVFRPGKVQENQERYKAPFELVAATSPTASDLCSAASSN